MRHPKQFCVRRSKYRVGAVWVDRPENRSAPCLQSFQLLEGILFPRGFKSVTGLAVRGEALHQIKQLIEFCQRLLNLARHVLILDQKCDMQ